MRLVLDVSCDEETYLIVIIEASRGHELSIHDSSDLVLYSSLWSDDINSFMLSSIPRKCREGIANKLEWIIKEYEGGVGDAPLEGLLKDAIRALKSL